MVASERTSGAGVSRGRQGGSTNAPPPPWRVRRTWVGELEVGAGQQREGAIDDVSGRGAIAHGEAFGLACRRQRLADRVHLRKAPTASYEWSTRSGGGGERAFLLDETHREELIEKLLGVLLDVDRPRRVAPFLSRFERRLKGAWRGEHGTRRRQRL